LAVTPLAAIPSAFAAGHTVAWYHAVAESDFAAGGAYALTVRLAGPSVLTVTATVDGSAWLCTITAAQSAALTPGTYQWEANAESGALRYAVDSGTLTVQPSLVTASAGSLVSHAAQSLPLLEAQYRDLAAVKLASYTIGQREAAYNKLAEIRAEIAACKREIARERNGGKLQPMTFGFTRAT
jgi:hypothetical protein